MEEQSNEALWYVVHTYSGYENKVANDLQTMVENRRLQDLICDIKVPTEMVPEIKDGKERMVEHKLFPGYVLVKMVMNDDTWYVVRNTRGCTGFVGPASKPVPLSAEEVEKMGVEKAAPLTVDFKVGDTVQITAGPLEGFMGLVEGIDTESFKVKLKVNMFGRIEYVPTPVVIDEATLKQIADITGGKYYRATGNKVLSEIFDEIDSLEKTELDVRHFSHTEDCYLPWALAALGLFLLELLLRQTWLRTHSLTD